MSRSTNFKPSPNRVNVQDVQKLTGHIEWGEGEDFRSKLRDMIESGEVTTARKVSGNWEMNLDDAWQVCQALGWQ